MPPDSGKVTLDDDELMTVLTEIENILDNEQFDDCVWQGDLNWHMGRNTGHAAIMERMVSRLGLTSVWSHFPIDFSHMHVDLKSVSTLDHFLVNQRLLGALTHVVQFISETTCPDIHRCFSN